MRVLFTITYYRPYVSGLTICAERIAEGLAKRGSAVSVLAMQHDPTTARFSKENNVCVTRSDILFRVSKGFISFSYFLDAIRAVRPVDTVVCNLPQPESVIPAFIARLTGKKVVVIYHCELELPAGFFNRLIQTGTDFFHFISLACAHEIVVYTMDYARSSRLLPRFMEKVTEIRPPIPELGNDREERAKITTVLTGADIVIGVAARLAREKGIEFLIEALPEIARAFPKKHVAIAVAGPTDPVGEASYKTYIKKKIASQNGRILFTGTIPPASMAAFYRSIDILAVPSVNRTEAFGLVQIEAMREGVPVVVSDLPGVRVAVTETGYGKVVPLRNPSAISDACIELLKTHPKHSPDLSQYREDIAIEQYERVLLP